MTEAGLITRLLQAAEDWGRRRYHEPVAVVGHSGPDCCADGAIRAEVELAAGHPGKRPRRTRCIVTLEVDGTLSCWAAGPPYDGTAPRT